MSKSLKQKNLLKQTRKHIATRARMRRLTLGMTQEELGNALGMTFQQVQKYEKGTHRVDAARLYYIAGVLRVPVSFFYEGTPSTTVGRSNLKEVPWPDYISDFLATSDGLSLTKDFVRIKRAKLRRGIVELVKQIAVDQ